ncbi:hypothetical protein CTI14_04210 [Methylobacterium radiotolerans]|nr:hypothetical protein CTI14_04210 [Methylobacterium radiotolerans]
MPKFEIFRRGSMETVTPASRPCRGLSGRHAAQGAEASARAKSTSPVLSETERSARETRT